MPGAWRVGLIAVLAWAALAMNSSANSAASSGSPRILVHGHRGARARRPENTIPAFRYAIEHGADVLELDLAVTKDSILVVSHDPLINLSICTGGKTGVPIHTLTVAELQQYDCGSLRNPRFPTQIPAPGSRIPTFDEVLDLAPLGSFEFNVETKIFLDRPELTPGPEEFTQLVLAAIRRHHLERFI